MPVSEMCNCCSNPPLPPFFKWGRGSLFLYALCSLLFAFSCLPLPLEAKVTGVCSNCHTMHNSQGGSAVAKEYSSGSLVGDTTPNPCLLSFDCIGCHFSSTATTIVNNTPIILNSTSPTAPLAGGNFYYVLSADNKGHNVAGIKAQDSPLGLTPPGGTAAMASQLTCAGQYGCHGNRATGNDNLAGVKGAHHTDDPTIDGSTVGKSYRFLNGTLGKEDTDWEQDNVNTSHNEYKGAIGFTVTTTISYLCGVCHGNFHSSAGVGSASPWLRHPTDALLKSTGEYANYTTYSMVAPVARPDLSNLPAFPEVRPGTDIIMCLSCHRAHASPNYKMMRWDYKSTTLSTALSGCNVCHTSKN